MTKQTGNMARLFTASFIFGLALLLAACPGHAADSSDARFNEALSAYQKRDFGKAAELFGQAGELYLKKGVALKAAQCFFNRGLCLVNGARSGEAMASFDRAAEIYAKAKDASMQSQSLLYAAQLYVNAMDWDGAQARYERAMKVGGKDKSIGAMASEGLGRIQLEKGNLAEAEKFFRQAEKLHEKNPGGALRVKLQAAYTIGLRGRETEALETYDAVISDASKLLKKPETADDGNRIIYYATGNKGQFLLRIGAFADAKKTLETAMKMGEKVENLGGEYSEGTLELRTDYAQSLMYLGDFGTAARDLDELLGIAEGIGNTAVSMKVNAALGTLSRMKGDNDAAFDFFTNFKSIAERANHTQRAGQALIQLANLYFGMGLWNDAAAYYQQAFYTALTAQDMDSAVRAMMGIYNGDLRNEMGLVGKVDYRTIQGLPWRSALTARFLRNSDKRRPEHIDRGFDEAWRVVDSRREKSEIPSLEGFGAIREIAFRGAPEVRDYYQEVKTSSIIADAVLRRAETDLSAARKAETALRELAARKDEAHERQYVDKAFSVTANLLRSLAGQELLTAPARAFSVQTDGLFLEAVSPTNAEPVLTELEDDIETLIRVADMISLKAADTEALQKALTAGQLMPEEIKSRLRKAVFARADKEPKPEELKEILFKTLESTQPTLRKEIGSLARKEGKLYDYANDRIRRQQAALRTEAEKIFPRVSPYMLVAIDSGGEMVRYINAWKRMRLRSMILADLGIKITGDRDWGKFLNGFGNAVREAGHTFETAFAMNIDDAAAGETAARLRTLAEKLTMADLEDEGRNIGSILAAEGNISYDDRMSVLDLQARIRRAMSKFDAAEQSARQILSMLSGEDVEAQPEKQWKAYGMLASIAADRGDHGEASRLYDIAINKLDSIHPVEGTTSQSASDRVSLYGGAVGSAYALWKESPSQENVSRVWRVLEGMKSRHWREMLATTGGEFLNVLPPEERERVRELEAKRVELEAAYNRARFVGRMDEAAAYNEEMRAVLAKRSELTRGKTVDVDSMPDAGTVRGKLPPDWALADYYISQELSFAVLLTKTGEPAVIPLDVDYDALFGYAYWMRYANNNIGVAEYDEKKFFSVSPGTDRAFVTACGLSPEDVGAMLLKPVAEACGDLRKLLVIPHDILYLLPLEAAQYQGGDGKPAYYVREWTFAELPSAFLLTRAAPSADSEDSSLILVANPTYAPLLGETTWMDYAGSLLLAAGVDPEFEKELAGRLGAEDLRAEFMNAAQEDRQAITSKLAQYWRDIVEETSRDSRISSAVKTDFAPFMKPLDGSQAEADDLAAMWRESTGGAPNVLLAGSASEEKFWNENPAKYRYVHIACHGYDRGSIPTLQPGLALSPIRDTKNDSFLQMGELASVKWNADLITLSACETGLGELYVGDGMLGLSTVLLAGGAKGIVVTRWRASDESAPLFMRELYSGILKDEHPADALRTAQLSVLNDSDYRVPRHWAIFKYVGIPW